MKVGVIGTGDVGQALARGFLDQGHEVMLGSRSADNPKMKDWVASAGPKARQGTFADAARYGDLVVLATLGAVNREVIEAAGPENLGGKVLIDATNPLDFSRGMPPGLLPLEEGSGGAQVQALAPQAKVVKAFNTIGNGLMYKPDVEDGPPTMFIAGNDADAKAQVQGILQDFGFTDTLDVGTIEASHYLECMTLVWVARFAATGSGGHAFRFIGR